jgi:hypothetical protein
MTSIRIVHVECETSAQANFVISPTKRGRYAHSAHPTQITEECDKPSGRDGRGVGVDLGHVLLVEPQVVR